MGGFGTFHAVPESLDPADLLTLLVQLEARVLADPVLERDYAHQRRRFPAPQGDEHAMLRFREWYLLEHAPEALGAPPALCWAPDEPAAGSPWEQLLAARFGVARFPDPEDPDHVEEMWTGRRVELAAPLPGADEETLLVGWLTATGEGISEAPLPGARVLAIPGLRAALQRDLAQARVAQPRSRLSQRGCEEILRGIAEAASAALGGGRAPSAEDFATALEALLVDQPGEDAERALAMRAQHGDEALLEELAFHTQVDLDETRRLLLEQRDAAATATRRGATATRGDADAETVAAALAAFDAAAGQASLAERFAELEAALGLEPGISEEGAPLDEEAEELGPEQLPGLPFWIASWAWETEQTAAAPSREELLVLAELTDFLGASHDQDLDAQDLARTDLLAFLVAAPDDAGYARRAAGLQRFTLWLENEQQAQLDGLAEALEGGLGERLHTAVRVNAMLASRATARDDSATLVAVDPLQVEGRDADVPVRGLPADGADVYRVGDRLLGRWLDGAFEAAAWIPQDVLPAEQPGS